MQDSSGNASIQSPNNQAKIAEEEVQQSNVLPDSPPLSARSGDKALEPDAVKLPPRLSESPTESEVEIIAEEDVEIAELTLMFTDREGGLTSARRASDVPNLQPAAIMDQLVPPGDQSGLTVGRYQQLLTIQSRRQTVAEVREDVEWRRKLRQQQRGAHVQRGAKLMVEVRGQRVAVGAVRAVRKSSTQSVEYVAVLEC